MRKNINMILETYINEYLYIRRCFSNSWNIFIISFFRDEICFKRNKPLKILLREAVMVYLSVLGGDFILQQVVPLQNIISAPTVFTSPPDF